MAAWLADNSFSWSKLKKSITAMWKCNASTLEPNRVTMRHQAKGRGARKRRRRRRAPPPRHIWLARLQSLSRQPVTGNRAWKGPRAGMKPQISRAASTSRASSTLLPALTHSLTHILPLTQYTHMVRMLGLKMLSILAIYDLMHIGSSVLSSMKICSLTTDVC